ncbi:velvet factor [Gorgonomyces haynaldii]|nr:velvet factor [Gorgonomyces haynaldii]
MTLPAKNKMKPELESLDTYLPSQVRFTQEQRECVLFFRQQPTRARMSGYQPIVSRSMDPIPIVQLKIAGEIRYTNLICQLLLLDENGNRVIESDKRKPIFINGDPVTNCSHLRDDNNELGYFFVFNSVGVSATGRYRFACRLFDIGRMPSHALCTIYSNVFEILNSGKFKGLSKSTKLMEVFRQQGMFIHLRPN